VDHSNPVVSGLLLAGAVIAVASIAFGGWLLAGGPVPPRPLRGFKSRWDAGLYCLLAGLALLLIDLATALINRNGSLATIAMIGGWGSFLFAWRHGPRSTGERVPRGWRHPIVLSILVIAAVAGACVLFVWAVYGS
jgi:hypothetical protein